MCTHTHRIDRRGSHGGDARSASRSRTRRRSPQREEWTALKRGAALRRLGIVVGALARGYFACWQLTKPKPAPPPPPPRPPWEVALETLDEVRHAGLLDAERYARVLRSRERRRAPVPRRALRLRRPRVDDRRDPDALKRRRGFVRIDTARPQRRRRPASARRRRASSRECDLVKFANLDARRRSDCAARPRRSASTSCAPRCRLAAPARPPSTPQCAAPVHGALRSALPLPLPLATKEARREQAARISASSSARSRPRARPRLPRSRAARRGSARSGRCRSSRGSRASRACRCCSALVVVVCALVIWRMTLAADARTPRLRIATIAPLLTGPRGLRTRSATCPAMLRGAALALALLALGAPAERPPRRATRTRRGIDIVLVLDLSGSMRALMDADPTRSAPPQSAAASASRASTRRRRSSSTSSRAARPIASASSCSAAPRTSSRRRRSTKSLLDHARRARWSSISSTATAPRSATPSAPASRACGARTRESKAIILLTDGDSNAGSIAPDYAAHLAQTQGVQRLHGADRQRRRGRRAGGHRPLRPAALRARALPGEPRAAQDSMASADRRRRRSSPPTRRASSSSMHPILDKPREDQVRGADRDDRGSLPVPPLARGRSSSRSRRCSRVLVVRRFP